MQKTKAKFIDPAMATDAELAAAVSMLETKMSTLTVPFTFSDLPLPTGAATEASVSAGNLILADVDSKLAGTLNVAVSNFPAQTPFPTSIEVSNFPTEPTSISVTNFPATQVVSGTVAVSNQPTSMQISNFPASQAVTGTFWQSVQPVSGTFFQAIQPITMVDGQKATYSACITGLLTATTPTDVFTISGSATKTVKITRLGFTGLQTTSAMRDIVLLKRSTNNTGGTSTSPVAVSYDSANAVATASVKAYTANPTALGTLVGNMRSYKYPLDANPTGTSAVPTTPQEWIFGDKGGQAVTLRGTGEMFCVNLNGVTSTGDSLDIFVEWTEE